MRSSIGKVPHLGRITITTVLVLTIISLCQPLGCSECGESLAFRCLDAPESKLHFKDRDFFKLARIDLFSMPEAERVEPVIVEPLSRPQTATLRDGSSVTASPQLASVSPQNGPSFPQPHPVDMLEADSVAVKGTNDGSLSWQLAHEDWTLKTKVTLAPKEFGKRILGLGGGKNPKPTNTAQVTANVQGGAGAGALKDRPSAVQDPSRMPAIHTWSTRPKALSVVHDQRSSAAGPRQHPGSSHGPSSTGPQRVHQPSPLQQQTNAQRPQSSRQPQSRQPSADAQDRGPWRAKVGHPYPQLYPLPPGYTDSADLQRRDIETLKMSVEHLQRTVQDLNDKLASIEDRKSSTPRSDQARDDALDALADSVAEVSSKAAKIDGIVVGMDTLRRKVKRLEGTSEVDASPSQAHPSRASFTGDDATPSTQPMPYADTSANGVKRFAPESFVHSEAKRLRGEAQPFTPGAQTSHAFQSSTATSTHRRSFGAAASKDLERHKPVMSVSDQSTPKKRGRPPKDRDVHINSLGTPQWEHDSWTGSQVDADGFYRPLQPHLGRGGNKVRKGAGYDASGKKLRRKPVRNEQGLLVKSDGTIDKRTYSSGANLKKLQEKRLSGLVQTSNNGTPANDATPNGTPAQPSPAPQTNGQNHGSVMSKMFPRGIAADASKLNAAEQLFSDQSPERPKMLMRDEMQRDEVAGGSPTSKRADSDSHADDLSVSDSPSTEADDQRHVPEQPSDAAHASTINRIDGLRASIVDSGVDQGRSPSIEKHEPATKDVMVTTMARAVPDSHSSAPSGITTPDVLNPPDRLKTPDVFVQPEPKNVKLRKSQASYRPSQVESEARD